MKVQISLQHKHTQNTITEKIRLFVEMYLC